MITRPTVSLHLGDCREVLKGIPDESIDAVICDPPYPEIDRAYGRMTEPDWHEMMRSVVGETRRILKSKGSAVFVLQPNSERVGQMRPWLWEFMAWTAREWNQVQDVWWWNVTTLPEVHAIQGKLMRPSLKACVWLGHPNCIRFQEDVLWEESLRNAQKRKTQRWQGRAESPSGHGVSVGCFNAAEKRGGVTPFNVLPIPNSNSTNSAGSHGHGAGTPYQLCDWWVRYITPLGGVVCDPFMGSGTVGLAALNRGRSFVGVEKMPEYHAIAERRIQAELQKTPLFD